MASLRERVVQPSEAVLWSAVRHEVPVQVTPPADVHVDHPAVHGYVRHTLTRQSQHVHHVEHRTEGISHLVIPAWRSTFIIQ